MRLSALDSSASTQDATDYPFGVTVILEGVCSIGYRAGDCGPQHPTLQPHRLPRSKESRDLIRPRLEDSGTREANRS
jgi:hypothetical protein